VPLDFPDLLSIVFVYIREFTSHYRQ